MLEDPEAACPWLRPDERGNRSFQILSVADVHDSLFAFARKRVARDGLPLREVQREVDESTQLLPSQRRQRAQRLERERRRQEQRQLRQRQQQAAAADAVKATAEKGLGGALDQASAAAAAAPAASSS